MTEVTKGILDFDKEDVDRVDQALKKFWDLRGNRGYPDWSPGADLYAAILALALLKSQNRLEMLTLFIIVLTIVLVVLTILLAILTLVTILR